MIICFNIVGMKIKEFAKRTGISESNIRYYDDICLLKENRSENNYRDFDKSDAIDLYRIKMLRSYGMSIGELKEREKMQKEDLSLWIDGNIEKLNKEIDILNKKLNRYMTIKSYVDDTVSKNKTKVFEDFYGQYIVYTFGDDVSQDSINYKDVKILSDNMPYTYTAIKISKESILNNKPSVTIGYGILDINRELLQLDLSESMTYIGRHSLIQYMFEKEDVTSFTMEELKPLIDYMVNHGGIEDITGRIYFSYQDKNKVVYSVGLAINK